jgi:hypothetical protein
MLIDDGSLGTIGDPRGLPTDAREEHWHVYYGDIHAGKIIEQGGPRLMARCPQGLND